MDVLQWRKQFFTENYFENLKKGNSKQLIEDGKRTSLVSVLETIIIYFILFSQNHEPTLA